MEQERNNLHYENEKSRKEKQRVIMGITDRQKRLEAIAQNIDLFTNKKAR